MDTKLTRPQRQRSSPVRRINIVPLLAILVLAAIGATLVMLFPMDWVRAPSVTVSAERSTISPNEDGNRDTVPIIYSLSEDSAVTVEVLDDTKAVVRKLVEEEPQAAGQHSVVWDGMDRLGQVLPDGEYVVQVTAQGTARSSSTNVRVNVDTQAPTIRLANMPDEGEVGGDLRELRVEGVTESGVTVWLNDQPQPLAVDEDGSFSTAYTLQEGENRIELVAVDKAGNRSSTVREYTLLTEAPEIKVSNPPKGLWINERMLSVQGVVPPGTQVQVNETKADVDEEGNFNVDVVLEEGENVVRVEATDGVGNTTVEERRVYLRTRPPALSLTSVRDGMTVREPSLMVVGQTEPQTTVTLNERELTVDSQGGFQGLVDLLQGENIIRVEAIGRAGNTAVVVREVTYTPATTPTETAAIPPQVRTVLAAAGVGLAGLLGLWLISGIWQRPLSLVLKANRPSLSAGVDGRLDPAVVVFEISQPATVTAEVWDASDQRVKTVFNRQRRAKGEHLLVWDGQAEDGRVVQPGVYDIEIDASTLFTTVSGSTRIWVEEDIGPSVVERPRRQRGTTGYE